MDPALQALLHFIPRSPSFYAGAALVALYQASRFAEVGRVDALTARYTTALGGVRARDFTDNSTYRLGLFSFVLASLLIYYFFCSFPSVLAGLGAVFQFSIPASWLNDQTIYPLYLAVLLVGVAQPVVPVFSKLSDELRIFFQDQANVPHGLNKLVDEWMDIITLRSAGNKAKLTKEIHSLTNPNWQEFRRNADLTFFNERYTKVVAGRDLDTMSHKELLQLIDSLLVIASVALMHKSGSRFSIIRKRIMVDTDKPESSSDLGYLWGSVFLFLLLSVAIWQVVTWLNDPVAYITGTGLNPDFWPDTAEYALRDVASRIVTTLGPLLLTLWLWHRSFKDTPPIEAYRFDVFSPPGMLDNLTAYARILFWCILFGMAVTSLDLLNGYAVSNAGPNLDNSYFERKLLVVFLQSLIPLPACYALMLTLESAKARRGDNRLWRSALFVVLFVSLTAFVYAKTHLQVDLLRKYADMAPGNEYLLLTVFVSVTMLGGAFMCIAIYVQRQEKRRAQSTAVPAVVHAGGS